MKDYVVLKLDKDGKILFNWQFESFEEAIAFAECLDINADESVEVQAYREVTETFETVLRKFIGGIK